MHLDPAETNRRAYDDARVVVGIEPASADLVIMNGNVAMHLIGQDWHGRPFDAAEHPLMIIEACPQGA